MVTLPVLSVCLAYSAFKDYNLKVSKGANLKQAALVCARRRRPLLHTYTPTHTWCAACGRTSCTSQ